MDGVITTLAGLVNRLDSRLTAAADVIRWASPVPSFGDLSRAKIATLGLNPSNREFVDESGRELDGLSRRFHTLSSLGLASWADADVRHLRLILESCECYFKTNPYDRWFKTLDRVIAGTDSSYYGATNNAACHLDLIPYATADKWTNLTHRQRMLLLTVAGDALALLLRDSGIEVVILNGQAVVDHFLEAFRAPLQKRHMPEWSLPRASSRNVAGFAYEGVVDQLGHIDLGRRVLVLGFNHNLQSSYGVRSDVIHRIGRWVEHAVSVGNFDETA